jgi:glycosyltransferase involved in cell wall biosynthesis
MRVAFAHHEPIDAGKARWVAMVRTMVALAELAPVTWFTPDRESRAREYAQSHLGLELPPSLTITTLPSVHRLAGLTINHVFFRACRRALAWTGADVLWLRSDKLAAHFARRNTGVPLMYEAHLIGPLWAKDRGADERAVARLERIERELYAGTAAVAAISAGLLEEIRARYGFEGPADVVPSAVDTGLFKPVWEGGDGRTVVYVGTLQFWKGLETLLEAIALAPGLRLRIVGDDDQGLRLRAAALGIAERVEVTGRKPQPQIPALVKDAACAVHPLPPGHSISARFTSPLKVFEYMALGLPIVAADVPSVREVLTDGANARLYRAGDAASLANALSEVAGNSALSGALSRQAAQQAGRFSYNERAKRLLKLMQALI